MQTHEIPREDWQDFLDDFSRQNEGTEVTVEVLAGEQGDQLIVDHWPLKGITYDGEQGTNEAITVMAGEDQPDRDVNHVIASPSRVLVARSEDGGSRAIKIESDREPSTLVTIHEEVAPGSSRPFE